MPESKRCTITYPKFAGSGVCNRLLPDDMCVICKAFEARKDEWNAFFNEYRDAPRVAVQGDI